MTMLTRIQLSALLVFAAALWAVALVIQGVGVSADWFRPFSLVLAALVFMLAVVDRWAWKLPWLQPWLVHMPNLEGTWCAEIRPKSDDTSKLMGFMVVRQTLSSISLRLLTEESASEIIVAKVLKADDGTFSIASVYRNTPKLSVRERSPVHHGALLLTVHEKPPTALDGQYWTDRNSQGEISLSFINRKCVHSFADASGVYASQEETGTTKAQEEATR